MTRQLEMLVEVLRAQVGGPRGYRLRRTILTNFWLFSPGRQSGKVRMYFI
jgi:hypothetical protein